MKNIWLIAAVKHLRRLLVGGAIIAVITGLTYTPMWIPLALAAIVFAHFIGTLLE